MTYLWPRSCLHYFLGRILNSCTFDWGRSWWLLRAFSGGGFCVQRFEGKVLLMVSFLLIIVLGRWEESYKGCFLMCAVWPRTKAENTDIIRDFWAWRTQEFFSLGSLPVFSGSLVLWPKFVASYGIRAFKVIQVVMCRILNYVLS